MGGNDLHENAQTILNELQNKLINRLDQLAAIFGESFLPRITEGKPYQPNLSNYRYLYFNSQLRREAALNIVTRAEAKC